ncbi:hypothetical protein [uncultured Lacinutrix sp.]|uniref:hypothetical protein n=1 Tax=uncultured Lacinutrix sp. TaxID=574032 RepID=UPI0026080F16|nr:hypothetical protein [uncultured Lacinutrix sp.]
MKHKIKILEKLKLVKDGSNKLPLNNLEIIVNSQEEEQLIGKDFIDLLEIMKNEKLILSDNNNWYFHITENGLDYLNENT